MEVDKKNQIRVGIFVAIGVILTMISIFLLGGDNLFKPQVRYHVFFDEVQGLNEGSVVSLSGIIVGNVSRIGIDKTKASKVKLELRIEKKYQAFFREGIRADIRTQGALGDKYIYLESPSTDLLDQAGLANSEEKLLPEYAEIPVLKSQDILSVMTSEGDRARRLFDILEDVHKITESLAANNRLALLVDSFLKSSNEISLTNQELRALIGDLRGLSASPANGSKSATTGGDLLKAIQSLENILTKIDKGEGSLGQLINDPSIHRELKSLLGAGRRENQVRSILRNSIKSSENPTD